MWLSERAAFSAKEEDEAASLGTVTIGGASAAVSTDGEKRAVRAMSVGGYTWLPRTGQNVAVLECGSEGSVIAGVVQADTASGLSAGEVSIASAGGAKITLKNDGSILIEGRVNIVGALTVNGAAVKGG
jgi:phage gp45-like